MLSFYFLKDAAFKKQAITTNAKPLSHQALKSFILDIENHVNNKNRILSDNFSKHFENYRSSKNLSLLFSSIHHYWIQPSTNNSEKTQIATKLLEEAAECPEGFHNRTLQVVQGIHGDDSLVYFLQLIRYGLVFRACSSNEYVHSQNTFFRRAANLGYGVNYNTDDDYLGSFFTEAQTIELLQQTFETFYTPIHILYDVLEQMKARFYLLHEYEGEKQTPPYYNDQHPSWLTIFKNMLGEDIKPLNTFVFDDDYNYNTIDINWSYITFKLFECLNQTCFLLPDAVQKALFILLDPNKALTPETQFNGLFEGRGKALINTFEAFKKLVLLLKDEGKIESLFNAFVETASPDSLIHALNDLGQKKDEVSKKIIALILDKIDNLPVIEQYNIIKNKQALFNILLPYRPNWRNAAIGILNTEDVNQVDEDGYTALTRAAKNGRTQTVQKLLQVDGINVNQTVRHGQTALTLAAQYGNIETLRILLQIPGIDVNQVAYDHTALILAAGNGRTEIVKVLLEAPKILVNKADTLGFTALMVAAAGGQTEIVQALLQLPNINVNQTEQHGRTALMLAAENGHTETVESLLKHPRINVKHTKFGENALILAAKNGHTETVKTLLQIPDITENGVDNASYGETALILAAYNGRTETVKALSQVPGIDVNQTDRSGFTALIWAAQLGRTEAVKTLLQAPGIDVNRRDKKLRTPLTLAAQRGHAETVRAFLVNGSIKSLSAKIDQITEATLTWDTNVQRKREILKILSDLKRLYKIEQHIKSLSSIGFNTDTLTSQMTTIIQADDKKTPVQTFAKHLKGEVNNHSCQLEVRDILIGILKILISIAVPLYGTYKAYEKLSTQRDVFFATRAKKTLYSIEDQLNKLNQHPAPAA